MKKRIFWLLVSGLILRLVLVPFGTHQLDFNSWVGWSNRLLTVGFSRFYQAWSDYLPGYLYVLWFLGQLKLALPFVSDLLIYKLPSILADILSAYLIFRITVRLAGQKMALLAAAIYLFNPAVLANSTLWGQADSFSTSLVLFSFFFLLQEKYLPSAIFLAFAGLTKPQNLIFLPFAALPLLKQKNYRFLLACAAVFSGVFFLGFWPFSDGKNLAAFIFERFQVTIDQYSYSSINAFNFWELLVGSWVPDTGREFFFGFKNWGMIIFAVLALVIWGQVWRRWEKDESANYRYLFFGLALISAATFMFLTRVHERHLFPEFVFLPVVAAIRPEFLLAYIGYSLTYILNLFYSFIWLNEGFRQIFSSGVIKLISLTNLFIFSYLLVNFFRKNFSPKPISLKIRTLIKALPVRKESAPENNFMAKNERWLLLALLLFSVLVRLWRLDYPPKFYFDEVYHAFTATEIVKGNPMAWEWWNTPPPGVAYEWTHPPLAKLGMALGIVIFGENGLGWRFFGGLLGVGCVLLVYLIGKKLFNRQIAYLAAALFALDGLPLVMSRIGMNDIYFLFFGLLAVRLFLSDSYFYSGAAFGLALASKWTAIYILFIFGFWTLVKLLKLPANRRLAFIGRMMIVYSFYFLVLPAIVYFLSYSLFFSSGHTLDQWWELQKQMWWYHTRLKATHPYTSPWWSWLILKRPVWLFVDYGSTSSPQVSAIANIYAMGNPLLWWGGLLSIPAAIFMAIKRSNRELGFVIFSYLSLFLPWAVSPRIMFIYHYLPAIPFLCLFLAWMLDWLFREAKAKVWVVGYLALVMLVFIFFYPHWTAIHVPSWFDSFYFWLPSWK